jgi:hypothetical protein
MGNFKPLRTTDVTIVRSTQPDAVYANVPHIVDRSPGGFEYGYVGAGPHDLALSILNAFVPPFYCGEQKPHIFDNGHMCSGFALRWADDFKDEVTDRLPREAGEYRLTAERINRWITFKMADQAEANDAVTAHMREAGKLCP